MNRQQLDDEMNALLDLISAKLERDALMLRTHDLDVEVVRLERLISNIEDEEILKGVGP